MDAKASAKSKRAHSLHGNNKRATPSNPNPRILPPQSAPNSSKNQGREKNRRSHASSPSPALPSNWDRYKEDGFDSSQEDCSIDEDQTGRASTDVVAPKSKGANFAELISQAQTDALARANPNPPSFASFDDVLPDLNEGVSSMLSVRGKCLLSWCGDDNFIVDDNTASSYEASFLSMDLHAVAAQLEKVDIPKRLFIEADLFPAELVSEEFHGTAEDGLNLNNENESMPLALISSDNSQAVEDHHTTKEAEQSTSFLAFSEHSTSAKPNLLMGLKHCNGNSRKGLVESAEELNAVSAAALEEKKRFEAAAAEAELDMLLNSFDGTKLLDSSSKQQPSNGFPVVDNAYPPLFKESSIYVGLQSSGPGHGASKHASMAVTLDDAIDDLLEGTSLMGGQTNAFLPPQEQAVTANLAADSSFTNSKSLDDFDSWLDTL